MIRRIPIRWRLALAFAAAMAVVLLGAGLVLRISLARELEQGVEQSLRIRSDEVGALVGSGSGRLGEGRPGRVSDPDESFAQLLDDTGQVVDASSPLLVEPLLTRADLRRARAGAVLVDVDAIPGADGRSRLLARPVTTDRGTRIVVVGLSLDARDEAVARLVPLLLVIGPVALLLASALGYAVAASALRPVEAMRREAAEISGARPGARLSVPEARDELRRLGETLNAMLERIDGAMQRERDFVADAGHELRTPLAILKAEVDVALMGERSADELRAALVSAREESLRLAGLSDDLLALARTEGGATALLRERVAAAELLEDVRRRFERRAAGEGRALRVDAPADLEIDVDRERIAQALGNLVDNALRHGAGTIVLSARPLAGGWELAVEDEGPGMDAAFVERAFERFTRGDAGRTGAGAGLGLSIVRGIARMHGGDAAVDVAPAGGGRVCIRLP